MTKNANRCVGKRKIVEKLDRERCECVRASLRRKRGKKEGEIEGEGKRKRKDKRKIKIEMKGGRESGTRKANIVKTVSAVGVT